MVEQRRVELEAKLLSTLAQPTRLKILYLLRDGERCACQITPVMKEDQSVISRHLMKLKEEGILDSEKQGVTVFYWIADPRVFRLLEMADMIVNDTVQRRAREAAGVFQDGY
ncbi:MAG: metalloregulator ArsR/SmtB family transcription factor [bacterium]